MANFKANFNNTAKLSHSLNSMPLQISASCAGWNVLHLRYLMNFLGRGLAFMLKIGEETVTATKFDIQCNTDHWSLWRYSNPVQLTEVNKKIFEWLSLSYDMW